MTHESGVRREVKAMMLQMIKELKYQIMMMIFDNLKEFVIVLIPQVMVRSLLMRRWSP